MTDHRSSLSRYLMPVVLLAGLGGLAFLTRLSWVAQRQQQQTARSLVTGLATRVADRYSNDLQGQIYIAATALLNRAGVGRSGTPRKGGIAEAILSAVPEVARCQCAGNLHPRYAFTANLANGQVEVVAADTSPVIAPPIALLREEMGERARLYGWEFAVAQRVAPGGVLLVFARIAADSSAIAGFAVDTAEARYRLLKDVDRRRGEFLAAAGLSASDASSLGVEIRFDDSTAFASLSPIQPGSITGATQLPRMFGGWRVTAGLTEAMTAGTVGTPVARSPFLLMLVLAALSALALLIAWSAARRASELAAMRASLITGISHELRTPLTEILLVGESLQRGQYRDGSDLRGAVDIVVREAHRLLGMISNMLQISINGGLTARVGVPQQIGDEVRRVVEDFRGIAAADGCRLTVTVVDDPVVSVDADAIRQILNNFLDNACKYGGPGNDIEVELHQIERSLRLSVRDHGAGVTPSLQESVWHPFVRGPQQEGRERSGSGIGLAVARQLAQSMAARTGIAQAVDGGAIFYLDLDTDEAAR